MINNLWEAEPSHTKYEYHSRNCNELKILIINYLTN